MVKIYVIDTNVLIQNPEALLCFEDNQVILPIVVLEELDHFKKAEGEKGRNARAAIRILEDLRQKGNLPEGVRLEKFCKYQSSGRSSGREDRQSDSESL